MTLVVTVLLRPVRVRLLVGRDDDARLVDSAVRFQVVTLQLAVVFHVLHLEPVTDIVPLRLAAHLLPVLPVTEFLPRFHPIPAALPHHHQPLDTVDRRFARPFLDLQHRSVAQATLHRLARLQQTIHGTLVPVARRRVARHTGTTLARITGNRPATATASDVRTPILMMMMVVMVMVMMERRRFRKIPVTPETAGYHLALFARILIRLLFVRVAATVAAAAAVIVVVVVIVVGGGGRRVVVVVVIVVVGATRVARLVREPRPRRRSACCFSRGWRDTGQIRGRLGAMSSPAGVTTTTAAAAAAAVATTATDAYYHAPSSSSSSSTTLPFAPLLLSN